MNGMSADSDMTVERKPAASTSTTAPGGADGDVKMRPVTVRLPDEVWQVIRDVAEENAVSLASVCRMSIASELSKYLRQVRYIDQEQGEEIQTLVSKTCDTLEDIHDELRRIGVNYNQEVKIKNIEAKYANMERAVGMLSIRSEREKKEAIRRATDGSTAFSTAEIESIMQRFESAQKEIGEQLCHILM